MLARIAAVVGTATVIATVVAAPAVADPPAVTVLSPASGVAGTAVVITGSGLSAVTAVAFPGAADVATTPVSDSEIDTVVPAAATSGAVVLRTPSGDVTGPAFLVLPVTTISLSRSTVIYPTRTAVTAVVRSGGASLPSIPAQLQSHDVAATTWVNGPTSATDTTGTVRFFVRPTSSTVYRVAFGATTAYAAVTTSAVRVTQHPLIRFTPPSAAPILTVTHLPGRVLPAQTGAVTLERRISGVWHVVTRAALSTTGRFTFGVTLPTVGSYVYRVRRPADAHQAGALTGLYQVLGVNRTLSAGMRGADVVALQKRLTALHYDLGGVTGTYDFDTGHAVVAFEKVQGLTRDGIVTARVWRALEAPRVPHLLHPISGVSAVEVDLTRQVLYYAVNAKIVRIFDSSTGGGYYYTGSDGTRQLAITPTGHFSVKYKVDHWVTSKLGVLYRPAYFNYSGYAIHGEPSVPSYPASHGCVRITVPAMNRFYAKLVVGMSVWIYRS